MKTGIFRQRNRTVLRAAAFLAGCAFALSSNGARADEGGVSFWVPGLYGSLAAVPQQPGWSFAAINYFTSVGATGNIAAAREVTVGKFNPTVNVNLNVNVHANADIVFLNPSYVFATPVLGGQLALGMAAIVGENDTRLSGTITAGVGPFTATRSGSVGDYTTGFGDIYPQATLRWNSGVNSWMAYLTGDIPVGLYSSSNLANLGDGHGAIDGGAGYTYFNPQTGQEFSFVTGITYNFENMQHELYEWHRLASRLGRLTVPVKTSLRRRRAVISMTSSPPIAASLPILGPIEIARHRRWSADRIDLSGRIVSDISQFESLFGVRRP